MKTSRWTWQTIAVCGLLAGCDDSGTTTPANTVDAGGASADAAASADAGGGADKDAGPPTMDNVHLDTKLWTKGAADPCNIKTGYPGDEYCIKPPDPKIGFQMHYGPSNYNDKAEVAKYLLAPGEEITDCVYMMTPNKTEVFDNEYHGRMRPGSHHMLAYVQDASMNPSGSGPQNCSQGLQQRNVFGAQTPTIDLLSSSSGAPEDQGLAQRLPAMQGAVMQLHFINTTKKPMLREAWANVIYVDKSKVKVQADPIFFLGGLGDQIKPGTHVVTKGKATASSDVRLVQATGHFHAHTVRFSAWKTIGGKRELLFEDFDWHEPSMFSFNSVTKNTPSDSKAQTKGAWSGIVALKAGDTIDWECEVNNDSQNTLGFGNEVFKAEMCNMFGVYSPGSGKPWSATNF